MVIDPGADVERILSEAKKENLEIVTIVNTHAHGDHTAGNAKLKSLTGAEIIIHALDAEGYHGADILVIDQETFQLGEITYDVIHTPGHTPGGICIYAQGNLFTGGGGEGRGGGMMRERERDVSGWYGPTPSSTLHWEKRNNVNAREYGYYVKD